MSTLDIILIHFDKGRALVIKTKNVRVTPCTQALGNPQADNNTIYFHVRYNSVSSRLRRTQECGYGTVIYITCALNVSINGKT